MRELLLLDLAGFRCGVWKEDILSHEEQIIHWLTDNNGAVTAIAMMGAHPVSLADLSYCIGLGSVRRAKRYPVLVPADHDLSVGFVVEQEAGMAQVLSSDVFSLPAYLQTAFIDSCVQLDGKLVPLINIRAIHCRLSAADYTPPTPQFRLSVLKEKRTPSLDSLRVFICKKKYFAASTDYFSSEQAVPAGALTGLPLMREFVRGITLHSNRVITVLDIRRYLQLSLKVEGGEGKWLIGEVEGQGFAFVVDADQGLLPADSAPLAALPLLVRSGWQQSVVLHARKIIPVLDFRELLAKPLDERSQALPQDLHSDGRFEAVFGKQQVEIVEFSIFKMIHALPDLEVVDIIPFTHCQRLTGTRGLVAGVTLYRKELLPVLDPARCFGRESSPGPSWKLLLVCNGDLRVLLLVEDVLGKRSLNVSEQRALPFTAPHSSVYGCYPVAGRVGLIFNVLALSVYFDDEQIKELFFFADDLLPSVNDVEPNIDQGTQRMLTGESSEQENSLLRDDFLGRGYAEEAELLFSGSDDEGATEEPFSFFEEQGDEFSLSSFESGREDSADDWELEKNASVLLTEEQDTLVQFVVASMLSRKYKATDPVEKDNQDDEVASDFLRFSEEPEEVVDRVGDIREDSDDIFPTVVAAMLSRKGDDLNELGDLDSEGETVSQAAGVASDVPERAPESESFLKEKECRAEADTHEDDSLFSYENETYENETSSSSEVDTPLEALPVLLTEEQDSLITSTLASMLLREQKGEGEETSAPGIDKELEGEQEVGVFSEESQRLVEPFTEPLTESQEVSGFLSVFDEPLLEDKEQLAAAQPDKDKDDCFFENTGEYEDASPYNFADVEELSQTAAGSDTDPASSTLLKEMKDNEQSSAAQSGQDDDLFDSKEERESSPFRFADFEEPNDVDSGLETESVILTQEQKDLLQSTLVAAFHQEESQENEQEGRVEGKKEQEHFDIFVDSSGTLEQTAELERARLSLQEDEKRAIESQEGNEDFFLPQEEVSHVPSEYTEPFKDLKGTEDDREQIDVPVAMFTEEQDFLLRSSLLAAFSQQEDGEGHAEELVEKDLSTPAKEREGNAVVDELAHGVGVDASDSDFQEKDEGSIEGLQNAGAINAEFSSSAARDAESNTERNADSVDGAGEQAGMTTRKEFVPDVDSVDGGVEKDLPHDVSAQLKDGDEASLVAGTWNVLEDENAFPELKDFVRQVSGTQQVETPLAIPPADFVKQVTFPTLSSPDPRKIKKQLDKARQKERDILFWKAEPEQEERSDIQPRDEKRNRTTLWILLFLLALFSSFFLWFFIFRDQEISRGKNIKTESYPLEINREASPLIQGAALEKREEDEGAGKNNQESIPAQSVSHSPDLSESKLALEGQEAIEQESRVISTDQSAQATFERTVTGSPVGELLEKIEDGSKILPENDRKQQNTTDHKELGYEQGKEGLVKSVHEDEERSGARTSSGGAADAVALKSVVAVKKGGVESSIGIFPDDTVSKGESAQQNVSAALRGIGKAPEESDAAQIRIDNKSEEQQQPVSAAHSSQGISANIVGDGQEMTVKGIPEVGILGPAGDRSKGIVEDRAVVLKSEEGFVGSVHEDEERSGARTSGRAADNSGDGAADDVAPKSAEAAKKVLVEDSIGTSSDDDAENESKGDSVPESVTVVSRKIGKIAEEVGIAVQTRVDEKRVEQQLPASAAHSSKGILVNIVRDGQKTQEAVVKSTPEVGVVDPAGDQGKGSVKDRATVQRLPVEKKQAGRSSSAAVASMSTQLVSAILTETGSRSVDQEKTINIEQSKERTTLADQQKILLMSPINGTFTHHTVSKGDTLWEISEQYTGSGFNYPDVAKKNKIANPDLIYPNQQVTLPAKK